MWKYMLYSSQCSSPECQLEFWNHSQRRGGLWIEDLGRGTVLYRTNKWFATDLTPGWWDAEDTIGSNMVNLHIWWELCSIAWVPSRFMQPSPLLRHFIETKSAKLRLWTVFLPSKRYPPLFLETECLWC